jgi:hypothetical protein
VIEIAFLTACGNPHDRMPWHPHDQGHHDIGLTGAVQSEPLTDPHGHTLLSVQRFRRMRRGSVAGAVSGTGDSESGSAGDVPTSSGFLSSGINGHRDQDAGTRDQDQNEDFIRSHTSPPHEYRNVTRRATARLRAESFR